MSLIGENLSHCYRKDRWIFKNVSIRIEPGETVGLSGFSGCGKTTLARVLGGYTTAQTGQVTVDGKSLKRGEFRPVQLIYQHPEKAVDPKWHMREVLSESYVPPKELLDAFEIRDEWMSRHPIELSGGELQRFCIVRALNPATKYIIADEMTTMLDAVTQAKIWYVFRGLCERRRIGVLVVSHEASLLDRLCDTVVTMQSLSRK